MAPRVFVAGIGTEVGKTIVSAIVVKALDAEYWKPIQSGTESQSDSEEVSLLSGGCLVHPEAYRLRAPMSPDAAAAREGVTISLDTIEVPVTSAPLVIEGAGGLMVPLNGEHTNLDLIERLDAPVLLVSRHYLGSINHTLLSVKALESRGIPLLGIIFNGHAHPETEASIARFSKARILGRVGEEEKVDQEMIARYADQLPLRQVVR